jgi:hypothetical protein
MNFSNQVTINTQASTAFRLPTSLLQVIDTYCGRNDLTRSQFIRHCIADRIKSLGLISVAQPTANEMPKWSPELYDRLQRRR